MLKVVLFTAFHICIRPLIIRKLRPGITTLKASKTIMSSSATSELRKEYSQKGLDEIGIPDDPFTLFQSWFGEACEAKVLEPNAMCLSTCVNNRPSARFVLLKAFDNQGFVWYTNYDSRKGNELEVNPYAALTFWWCDLERSVRIEGVVNKVSEAESDSYFASRPRNSQIGAWSSNQSRLIADREMLEKQQSDVITRFEDASVPIPRPPHWGGYRLKPSRIEFWKGRESRLHDRIVFDKQYSSTGWTHQRIQP